MGGIAGRPSIVATDEATPPSSLRVVATRDHFELPDDADGTTYVPAHLWALVA